MTRIFIFFVIFNLFILPIHSLAMSSTNYQINIDEFNESGGSSSSTNYQIWSNLGEQVTGTTESANYKVHQGFITTETPILIFSISGNSISFGTLTSDSVKTGNITLTLSTNAASGYSVQAYDNTTAGIANGLISVTSELADATTPNSYINLPSAGTEHYGVTVTGTHATSGYSSGTKINSLDNTTWVDIGSYSGFISDDVLTVQYRASISGLSPASSNYQAISTFVATGNF